MKRAFRVIAAVTLIIALLCSVGFAEMKAPKKNPLISRIEMAKLIRMVEKANEDILKAVRHAQATVKDDVDQMLRKVDRIVNRVMIYAKCIGATVRCEYTMYVIDGREVWVDPLHVVNV